MTKLLNTEHPRLFINEERISSMKEQTKGDTFFRSMVDNLLRRANALMNEDTVEFKIVGPRMLKNCQEIHSRVSILALAYHLSEDKKYASRAVAELVSAANFPHWNKDHFLDTAELITAFAIGYDWLYHVLSDDEKNIIKKAMTEKGLEVGLEEHARNIWWAGHKFNWNQVCNGGLIIGALSIADENPELINRIFDATVKFLPIAFNSYGKDGGWEGGPDYWAYTTWYSVLLVEVLLSNTGDDFGLSGTEGFNKTGLFPIYNSGTSGLQFNFADADPDDTHKAYPALFWLGTHFGIDASINENHRLLQISIDRNQPIDAFNLVWYAPMVTDMEPLPVNRIFRGINAGYLRKAWDSKSLSLAFKGGYNLADHAHLDMGTFVLDYNNIRWVSDLGRDDYDLPDYFDKTVGGGRWQYFRLNTKSHNTLLLNDEDQQADARARIVDYDTSTDESFATVDLSEAYTPYANSVIRTYKLNGNNKVTITDKIERKEGLQSIQWQMLTETDVEVSGNRAILSLGGKQMEVNILQPESAAFELASAEQAKPELLNEGYKLLKFRITEISESANDIVVQFES